MKRARTLADMVRDHRNSTSSVEPSDDRRGDARERSRTAAAGAASRSQNGKDAMPLAASTTWDRPIPFISANLTKLSGQLLAFVAK